MQTEADRLWQRSVRVGRTAIGFFILAMAGPAVLACLLIRSIGVEWYLMFGGFSLAAVPLFIGMEMLKHAAKLLEQYREVARNVEHRERLDFALECVRNAPAPSATRAQAWARAFEQILAYPLASSAPSATTTPLSPPSGQSAVKEVEGDGGAVILQTLSAMAGALQAKGG
jgi:hypothetical protein